MKRNEIISILQELELLNCKFVKNKFAIMYIKDMFLPKYTYIQALTALRKISNHTFSFYEFLTAVEVCSYDMDKIKELNNQYLKVKAAFDNKFSKEYYLDEDSEKGFYNFTRDENLTFKYEYVKKIFGDNQRFIDRVFAGNPDYDPGYSNINMMWLSGSLGAFITFYAEYKIACDYYDTIDMFFDINKLTNEEFDKIYESVYESNSYTGQYWDWYHKNAGAYDCRTNEQKYSPYYRLGDDLFGFGNINFNYIRPVVK